MIFFFLLSKFEIIYDYISSSFETNFDLSRTVKIYLPIEPNLEHPENPSWIS